MVSYRELHVMSISYLRHIAIFEIFHNLANLTCTAKRDWVFPVKLSVIPIHFGQTQQFFSKADSRMKCNFE